MPVSLIPTELVHEAYMRINAGSNVNWDPEEILARNEALVALEAEDERLAEIVTVRYFAELIVEETARALGIAERTVYRDWATARA
ncbi:MAG: DNA-directed RNA polymerase specialized sigma24 family protein [Candidatus Paceibacteria bacterium]|jgi:DNA-directed RNA polymerase specialized sigma24 family protein